MMIADINKFSWKEMVNNSSGKTSASGAMASLTVIVGLACFVFGCINFIGFEGKPDVLMYSSALVTGGLGVLGYRKSKDITEPLAVKEPVAEEPLNS